MIKKIIEKLYWKYYEDNIEVGSFTKEETDTIFSRLQEDDEFIELLKSILKGDIKRYFNAGNDVERYKIRGDHRRTLYILRKIIKKDIKKTKVIDTKIAGRYGE